MGKHFFRTKIELENMNIRLLSPALILVFKEVFGSMNILRECNIFDNLT